MSNQRGMWDLSFGQIGAGLQILGSRGIHTRHWEQLLSDHDLVADLSDLWIRRYIRKTYSKLDWTRPTPVNIALEIMGDNGFSVQEVERCLDFSCGSHSVSLAQVPWGVETLLACRSTHILIPGLATLEKKDVNEQLLKKMPNQIRQCLSGVAPNAGTCAYNVGLRWYLLRQGVIAESINKTKAQQKSCLASDEEIPNIHQLLYMIGIYQKIGPNNALFSHDVRSETKSAIFQDDSETYYAYCDGRVSVDPVKRMGCGITSMKCLPTT